jgi:hypothetical protein
MLIGGQCNLRSPCRRDFHHTSRTTDGRRRQVLFGG